MTLDKEGTGEGRKRNVEDLKELKLSQNLRNQKKQLLKRNPKQNYQKVH